MNVLSAYRKEQIDINKLNVLQCVDTIAIKILSFE